MPNMRSGRTMPEPDIKTLQQNLDDVRQEVRNLVVMGMQPNRPPISWS
jgi:hypothetical protein